VPAQAAAGPLGMATIITVILDRASMAHPVAGKPAHPAGCHPAGVVTASPAPGSMVRHAATPRRCPARPR